MNSPGTSGGSTRPTRANNGQMNEYIASQDEWLNDLFHEPWHLRWVTRGTQEALGLEWHLGSIQHSNAETNFEPSGIVHCMYRSPGQTRTDWTPLVLVRRQVQTRHSTSRPLQQVRNVILIASIPLFEKQISIPPCILRTYSAFHRSVNSIFLSMSVQTHLLRSCRRRPQHFVTPRRPSTNNRLINFDHTLDRLLAPNSLATRQTHNYRGPC